MKRNTTKPPERKGPGRPRDPEIGDRVLSATLAVLERDGYAGLTIERVAIEAGVSRPTVYRRWPSKSHLLLDAVKRGLGGIRPGVVDERDVRRSLENGVVSLGRGLEGALGRATPAIVAELAVDPALASRFLESVFRPRRASMAAVIREGIARGDVEPDVDVELILDLLAAPLYYRAIFRHAPVSRATARATVDLVWKAIARPRRRARSR